MKDVEFVNQISLYAQEVQLECGLFTSVTIAQACLETGYNTSRPIDVNTGEDSYNIFGMKASGNQPYVTAITTEVYSTLPSSYIKYEKRADGGFKVWIYAKFRKFSDLHECFSARAQLFKTSKYYAKAVKAKTPEDAVYYLIHTGYFNDKKKEIGYATDPSYISKIVDLITRLNLKQFDLSEGDITMINTLQTEIVDLKERIAALEKQGTAAAIPNNTNKQQEVASWAKKAHEFVTTPVKGKTISDGTRPKDIVTREEAWTMFERYHALYGKEK